MTEIIYRKVIRIGREVKYVPIDAEVFEKLLNAKSILTNALDIENLLHIPIENLIQFEKDILNEIVEHIYKENMDYEHSYEVRVMFQRHLSNIILSTELFIDKGKGLYWRLFDKNLPNSKKNEYKSQFDNLLSEMYDAHSSYKICATLINYLKHNNLAVHGTSSGSKWDTQFESLSYRLNAYILKSELILSDKRFKKICEKGWLEEVPEKIEILPTVKKYISCLSQVLNEIREKSKYSVNHSVNLIKKEIHNSTNNYAKIEKIKDNEILESFNILLSWEEVRQKNVLKYNSLIKLEKRQIGSEYNKAQK